MNLGFSPIKARERSFFTLPVGPAPNHIPAEGNDGAAGCPALLRATDFHVICETGGICLVLHSYTTCVISFLLLLNSVRSNHSSSWLLFPKLSYAVTCYVGSKTRNKEFIHSSMFCHCNYSCIIIISFCPHLSRARQRGDGQSLTLTSSSFFSCLHSSLQHHFNLSHFSPGTTKQVPSPSHPPPPSLSAFV